MNRFVVVTSTLALAFFQGLASGQSATDFSGTWEMDVARSESAHTGEPVRPTTLVISQGPKDVTVETKRGNDTERLVYRLDGTDTTRPETENGPFSWKARWEGAKLVLETTRNVNKSAVTFVEICDLDPSKKQMTVERTITVQHGYTGDKARNSSTAKDTFVKRR